MEAVLLAPQPPIQITSHFTLAGFIVDKGALNLALCGRIYTFGRVSMLCELWSVQSRWTAIGDWAVGNIW